MQEGICLNIKENVEQKNLSTNKNFYWVQFTEIRKIIKTYKQKHLDQRRKILEYCFILLLWSHWPTVYYCVLKSCSGEFLCFWEFWFYNSGDKSVFIHTLWSSTLGPSGWKAGTEKEKEEQEEEEAGEIGGGGGWGEEKKRRRMRKEDEERRGEEERISSSLFMSK